MKVKIEVIEGAEGPCLVLDGWRVSGPKPWGGGKTVYSFEVSLERLKEFIFPAKM